MDPGIQAYHTAITGLKLEDVTFGPSGTTLLCDTSSGQPRPIVLVGWRHKGFDMVHGLSHPSVRATRQLMSSKFVWHGIRRDVVLWAKACVPCQTSKVHQHIRALLQTFQVPHRHFDHIHVDLVGPLPPSQGFTHLLTVVDHFTRWPEAISLTTTTAHACAQALVSQWITRFGVPIDMSSDRGSQFTSQLWDSMSKLLGTKLHHTTVYHPQANGLVERFHRHLKSALRARLSGPNWVDKLPWILLGIRTALRRTWVALQQSWFMAPLSRFQGISSLTMATSRTTAFNCRGCETRLDHSLPSLPPDVELHRLQFWLVFRRTRSSLFVMTPTIPSYSAHTKVPSASSRRARKPSRSTSGARQRPSQLTASN